jgi:hypothetical protein
MSESPQLHINIRKVKTMRKFVATLVLASLLTLTIASVASADPGGAPGAHGVSGRTWGQAVSGLAQSAPGAVADHIQMAKGR